MANEKFLVVFDTQGAGDALAGYKWQNVPSGAATLKPVAENISGVEVGRVVSIGVGAGETLTAQEACTAVRKAYGDSMVSGAMKVVALGSVEEKTA